MPRNKKSILKWVILSILLLATPIAVSEWVREKTALLLSPIFSSMQEIRWYLLYDEKFHALVRERDQLRQENFRIKNQLLANDEPLFAKVIYRSFNSWMESLWIDMGQANSSVEINSIIVSEGDIAIGLVDYVGEKSSRVRLITGSKIIPSIKFIRNSRREGFPKKAVFQTLAFGELRGTPQAAFRFRTARLEAIAFSSISQIPKIIPGDVIVTSGLDGLFPQGLRVARIIEVTPPREGDYEVEVVAETLSERLLSDLYEVRVWPPVSVETAALLER